MKTLCVIVVLTAGAFSAPAIASSPADTSFVYAVDESRGRLQHADERLLRKVYEWDHRAVAGAMRGLDDSSYAVFYTAPLWLAGYSVLSGDRHGMAAAYRLGVAEAVAYKTQRGLKRLVGRQRPFDRVDGLTSRSAHYPRGRDVFAFPSGHAAASFTIAASLGMSFPEWYVIAPATAWAAGVSMSRVWHGVHYPSDVLAGAIVGVMIGSTVHRLGDRITPGFLRPPDRADEPPARAFMIGFSVPIP